MKIFKLTTTALVALGLTVSLASAQATVESAQKDLDKSLAELNALRERIEDEKLPLSAKMRKLEQELAKTRERFDDVGRNLDTGNLDIGTLQSEVTSLQQNKTYLSSLLDEYLRNFEARVHITELQRYRQTLDDVKLVTGNQDMTPADIFDVQTQAIDASLDRLLEAMGGTTFPGTAVNEKGAVKDVDFALLGPVALYSEKDGSSTGLVEQKIGSLEPNMLRLDSPQQEAGARELMTAASGTLPFDPSMGDARKLAEVEDTLLDKFAKGGPVMWPILGLALAALLLSLIKLIQLMRVPTPRDAQVKPLLEATKKGDYAAAQKLAQKIGGPIGGMLQAGTEHLDEPKALIEEVMYERTLETRLKLNSLLPFVSICATAAPLLGLLGTVTGIIETFKLMTVFGTGDAKTLSSGISEALLTTAFGLVVAIPALLLHAYLSRKARRVLNAMERAAVQFLNRISPRTHAYASGGGAGSESSHRSREMADFEPRVAEMSASPARHVDH